MFTQIHLAPLCLSIYLFIFHTHTRTDTHTLPVCLSLFFNNSLPFFGNHNSATTSSCLRNTMFEMYLHAHVCTAIARHIFTSNERLPAFSICIKKKIFLQILPMYEYLHLINFISFFSPLLHLKWLKEWCLFVFLCVCVRLCVCVWSKNNNKIWNSLVSSLCKGCKRRATSRHSRTAYTWSSRPTRSPAPATPAL